MGRQWIRSERELAIRASAEADDWDGLDDGTRFAIWTDRTYYTLLGDARHDLVKHTNLTIEKAAALAGLGDFQDLAREVAQSFTADDPRQANKAFPGRDIISMDPDDEEQWPGLRKFIIGRTKNIVLPHLLSEGGKEAQAAKDALPPTDLPKPRAVVSMSDDVLDVETAKVDFGDGFDDIDGVSLDDFTEDDLDAFLDDDTDFDFAAATGYGGALETALPGLLEETAGMVALAAAAAQADEPGKGIANGAGGWVFDEEVQTMRYFTPREALEARILDYWEGYNFDPFIVAPKMWAAWEQENGRSATMGERAEMARLLGRLRKIGEETIEGVLGVKPSHEDFSRRLVCGPFYAGTPSGAARHRDKVSVEVNPLSVGRKSARRALGAAEKRGADVDAAMQRAITASDAYMEALEARFAHRVRLPGVDRPEADANFGSCDLCSPPKSCGECGAPFRPTHKAQTKCVEHRRAKKEDYKDPAKVVAYAYWVDNGDGSRALSGQRERVPNPGE